jgi:hypothetical protein
MDPDALEAARSRYRAAYVAYLERARRVAGKLENGLAPSVEEIMEEANATEELAAARRALLDAMAKVLPKRP